MGRDRVLFFMTVTASLVVQIKPSADKDWEEIRSYSITGLPAVRIGRLKEGNDLDLPYCQEGKKRSYVSRRHCTLYLKALEGTYEIMDGTIAPINASTKQAKIQPSSCGVIINRQHKLDPYLGVRGERWLLRDHDIITIVPNQIELIYRQYRTDVVIDGLDTFALDDEEEKG